MTNISKIVVAVIGFGMCCSTAHACAPPAVGDQFQYNNGTVMEIASPVDMDCDFQKRKVCLRPADTKQPCRWVSFPADVKDGKWLVLYGTSQD